MSTSRTRSLSVSETTSSISQIPPNLWSISSNKRLGQQHYYVNTVSRKGKRRHRDHSLPDSFCCSYRCEKKSSKLDESPRFATTSSEFRLSSRAKCLNESPRRLQSSGSKISSEDQHICLPDIVRLRSTAFWELRQSVAENGEGLVRRMRDYERSRSRNRVYRKAKDAEKRGRKRLSQRKKTYMDLSETSDDDEILVSSVEFSKSILCSAPAGKRARSMDAMDMDVQNDVWSPPQQVRSRSSVPSTDFMGEMRHISSAADEDQPMALEGASSTVSSEPASPPLSSPTFESADSSLLSVPLSSPGTFPNKYLPACASDRAVAALTLALANGAGSINDYSSIWSHQGFSLSDQSHDHGELWH